MHSPDQEFFMPADIVNDRRNNPDQYANFFVLFVAPVVGKKRFESLCWRQKLSKFVTVSDEALALLLFENNYYRWLDMGRNWDWTTSQVRPKFTTGGNAYQTPKFVKENANMNQNNKACIPKIKSCDKFKEEVRESTCAKYQGWSLEGLRRYNNFFDKVQKERVSDVGIKFEGSLLELGKKLIGSGSKKASQKVVMYEACRHKLWNMEGVIVEEPKSPNNVRMIDNVLVAKNMGSV